MRHFLARLWELNSPSENRRWVYVPYDQLNDGAFSLIGGDPSELGIVMVESLGKGKRRPYHKQKLALVLANQRQFALEQARRGVAVRYILAANYDEALGQVVKDVGVIHCMEPAERELRHELAPFVERGELVMHPNRLWLTTAHDFEAACGSGQWRMDRFYRHVRKKFGVLIDSTGKPTGGRWSLDGDNRQRWSGYPEAPTPPTFEADAIVKEVVQDIEQNFGDHPGTVNTDRLPTTAADAQKLWAWSKANCMTYFGPFEDAMSVHSRTLFHTLVSSLVNNGRLTPVRLINEVLPMEIPLNSKEGFVRQVLGWREFVRHVHEQSDGFRQLPEGVEARVQRSADGAVNHLGAELDLPPVFWGVESGFNCLDHAVGEVLATGYTHHINRLMILSNWAVLIGASPRQLTDWFWVMFTDAYDWVVEPNVLGMSTFAAADLMSTKPYVSGSAYVKRMSDYCDGCSFTPGKDCPMTAMYWNFLNQHHDELGSNPRMKLALTSASRRTDDQKRYEAEITSMVQDALVQGKRLVPEGRVDAQVLSGSGG